MKLYKTTIIIWSRSNGEEAEISDLAQDAMNGEALCTQQESRLQESDDDPEADAIQSFFDDDFDDFDDDDFDDDDDDAGETRINDDENLGQCD